MILVDTDVWSRHFRENDPGVVGLLDEGTVVTHPWVVGELALGPGLRLDVLADLRALPALPVIGHEEQMAFIELHALRGVGWVDCQLLLVAMRSRARLWTLDAGLRAQAERFEVAFEPA